jgi:hypothetical protein
MRYCTVLLGNAWLGKHKNKLGACGNSGQTANHKRLFGVDPRDSGARTVAPTGHL